LTEFINSGWEDSGGSDNTDNGKWDGVGSSPTVVASPVNSGSYACRFNNSGEYVYFSPASAQPLLYFIGYVRFDVVPSANGTQVEVLRGYAGGTQVLSFGVRYYTTQGTVWTIRYYDGAVVRVDHTADTINANTWYYVILMWDKDSGEIQLWIDGDNIGGVTGEDLDNYGDIDTIRVGETYEGVSGTVNTYWDDFVLADEYPSGLETYTKTFTADAHLLKRGTKAFTSDSHLLKRDVKTFDSDAHLLKRATQTFNADAYLIKRDTKTFDIDALLLELNSKGFTIDSHLLKRATKTFSADASLLKRATKTLDADAYLLKRNTKTFTSDALLLQPNSKGFTTDAHLLKRQTKTFTTDALLLQYGSQGFTLDAHLQKTSLTTFTADAYLMQRGTATFSGDAILLQRGSVTFSLDAILIGSGGDSARYYYFTPKVRNRDNRELLIQLKTLLEAIQE
jgi:hypothetical protein